MTLRTIKSTKFMTGAKIAEESDARLDSLNNEICITKDNTHKQKLINLRKRLQHHSSETFANIVYASQQQEIKYVEIKHLIDNYKLLAESKKLNPDDVYFVTINCCEGYLDKYNKPTTSIIIYCAHIDYTLGLQDILKERGIDSYVFNSKIDNKKEILKRFKKENCIVIATSAFGMGIDKPDVHLVICSITVFRFPSAKRFLNKSKSILVIFGY